jgi:hypothetical protein
MKRKWGYKFADMVYDFRMLGNNVPIELKRNAKFSAI